MTGLPPRTDIDLFDEAGYLRLYPGIADAVMRGLVTSPWDHYVAHGRQEGRQPNDVDPDFYLAAYPAVAADLGHPPAVTDAAAHYIALGRARGYVANAGAERALNGASLRSPFGGFWTDQANALDLIQARLDLARIDSGSADLLRQFALDGIAGLDRPVDRSDAVTAGLAVDQAFAGALSGLLFDCSALAPEPLPWRPDLSEQTAAALDPHMFSGIILKMVLDRAVMDFLSLIFDARPCLTGSRAYVRQSAGPERDAGWFAHTLPLQFVAVTFSLDETTAGGETIWPGTHQLSDLPWTGQHLTLSEARRAGAVLPDTAITRRAGQVRALLDGRNRCVVSATFGGRMVRHGNLFHEFETHEAAPRRRAVTAWYCPSYSAPCYLETTRSRMHARDGVTFCSGIYPAREPDGASSG